MLKPVLYFCCERSREGEGGKFDEPRMFLTTEVIWKQEDRIKKHPILALRKAASTPDEAGQHRGRMHTAPGTRSLTAED